MTDTRWDCCGHCDKPCPPNGHSKPCEECAGNGTGIKAIGEKGHRRAAYAEFLANQGGVRT